MRTYCIVRRLAPRNYLDIYLDVYIIRLTVMKRSEAGNPSRAVDAKAEALRRQGALHPHPDTVHDEAFRQREFLVGPKSCQSGFFRIVSACLCVLSESLRLEVRPRTPWTTTASPCFFIRLTSLRTHRAVTPIFSAASRCVMLPASTRFSQCTSSRSSWLIAIRSILQPCGCQEELSIWPRHWPSCYAPSHFQIFYNGDRSFL